MFKILYSRIFDFSHVYSKLHNKIKETLFMAETSITPVVFIKSELDEYFGETRALQKMSEKTAIS